jgi:hypothetical protein
LVLAVLLLYRTVFEHRDAYRYSFGDLSTTLYVFWSGPFTTASFGTYEFGGYPKSLPDVYLHWQDGRSLRLLDLDEAKFIALFGQTHQPRRDGQSYGQTHDVEIGFMNGKPVSLKYFHREGWPCFSVEAKAARYCFPLYWWEARALFGRPDDATSAVGVWH